MACIPPRRPLLLRALLGSPELSRALESSKTLQTSPQLFGALQSAPDSSREIDRPPERLESYPARLYGVLLLVLVLSHALGRRAPRGAIANEGG
eukprot:1137614-Alexandrium_andersonii.AAC.1